MSGEPLHTAVIGAGITGLAAAFYLQREMTARGVPPALAVLEAQGRIGGRIKTLVRDGFIMEQGPDSFLAHKAAAAQLVRDVGLEEQLVRSEPGRSYVVHDDRLYPFPAGTRMGVPTRFLPILASPLVSPADKWRVIRDLLGNRNMPSTDQPAGDFLRRRFGPSIVAHLIEPLITGIYGGSIDRCSLQALFPGLYREARARRGANPAPTLAAQCDRRTTAPVRHGSFLTLKGGLQTLVTRLDAQFAPGTLCRSAGVASIHRHAAHYRLALRDGRSLEARNLVVALPAGAAAALLPTARDAFRPLLERAPAGAIIVSLAIRREAVGIALRGTGFLVPRTAGCVISACTWTHLKWPHTTPPGYALLRCYLGDAGIAAVADDRDEVIVEAVLRDLKRILMLHGGPDFCKVQRWPMAMPQYAVGHLAHLATLRHRLALDYPGVILAGASYGGVGLPDCIDQGKTAAHEVMDYPVQRAA